MPDLITNWAATIDQNDPNREEMKTKVFFNYMKSVSHEAEIIHIHMSGMA
jgi:hypothetical protein